MGRSCDGTRLHDTAIQNSREGLLGAVRRYNAHVFNVYRLGDVAEARRAERSQRRHVMRPIVLVVKR